MNVDEFKSYLDKNDIRYKESGVSLALQNCPECGSDGFKVLLRVHGPELMSHQPFLGRCQRGSCNQNYSSISYLIRSGLPKSEVLQLHGMDPSTNLRKMAGIDGVFGEALIKEEQEDSIQFDRSVLDTFYDVNDWLDHPVAKYAYKRGFTPSFSPYIKLDIKTESVVFLIHDKHGNVVGYQKRFVFPAPGMPKTWTAPGFKKTEHILMYRKHNKPLLVCEGPFTALSAWHYGYTGIATLGAKVSDTQLEIILALSNETKQEIMVAVESDEAGQTLLNSVRSYIYRETGKTVKSVSPEAGKDLNDSWQAGKGVIVDDNTTWAGPAMPKIGFMF